MSDPRGRALFYDGVSLSLDPLPGARRLIGDARCFEGAGETDAWASVCASVDPSAVIPYDAPEVQFARAEALAWWIPLLGEDLVCTTTLAIDAARCAGAITVARRRAHLDEDPFARLFSPAVIRTSLFAAVPPPSGPVIERYTGAPWPVTSFERQRPIEKERER